MADSSQLSYAEDPTLYLYTSLTAGSSHIITATSRLETILKANKIAFRAIDTATDEKARMIWGRRSRGRKLPGLVKYAQIVGDLEQIEEWNEYGELKEQIDDTSVLETTTTQPPAPTAAQVSTPASRDSSQTRHISITEPTKPKDGNPASTLAPTESPMAMAMRQAGAEAAAKAGQKKTVKPMPPAPDPSEKEAAVEAKIASPMADPSADPEMTQAKAPAQLAAEGAKRTSVDKIAETASPDANAATSGDSDTPVSTEQQVAELRRTSSIAKAPSKLSETQTNEEAVTISDKPKFEERPRTHRGSSLSEASREEIKEVEKRNSIEEKPEEEEEEDEEVANKTPATKDVEATDEGEKPAEEDVKHEKLDVKDGEAAGASVGD